MSSLGTNDRLSYVDSNRSSIDVTANFGARDAPRFGTEDAALRPGTARFGLATLPTLQDMKSSAGSGLVEVEGLGTADLATEGSSTRSQPTMSPMQTPVIMQDPAASFAAVGGIGALQEITQNLRKTMVGLSNEVKARENEDWRLEQGFTQLDSRRELMCVQLHTRYEQSKNELEALGRQVAELQRRSDGSREVLAEATSKIEDCSVRLTTQSEESRRVGLLLDSETNSLKVMIERLQEKQASLESRTVSIEAKTGAALAKIEAAPGEPAPSHAALDECMAKQAGLERRCEQLEDTNVMHKAEANLMRQALAECRSQLEKDFDGKFGALIAKTDASQESLANLQALLQSSEENQRGKLREMELLMTAQKAQFESWQESVGQHQARSQQQRIVEERQLEQLETRTAGYDVRIESLVESVTQLQAWSQQQRLIEQKRSQIDEYNKQHRAETDDLRMSLRQIESQIGEQAPVQERSALLDARESTQRVELEKIRSNIIQITDAVAEIRVDNEKWKLGISTLDDKCSLLETRLADCNAEHKHAADLLRESFSGIQATSRRFETRVEEFATLLPLQEERLKAELSSLQQVQKLLQTSVETLQAKFDIEKPQLERIRSEVNDLQKESRSRLDAFQSKFEVDKAQLQKTLREASTMDASRLKAELGVVEQAHKELRIRFETLQSTSVERTLNSSTDTDFVKSELVVLQKAQRELQFHLDSHISKSDIERTQFQQTFEQSGVGTFKNEFANLQEVSKALQLRIESLEAKAVSALQTPAQTSTGVAEGQKIMAQVLQLEVRGTDQQREANTLRGLIESLQGRMESFQAQSEISSSHLKESLRKECESIINVQLRVVQQQGQDIDQLISKFEANSVGLRSFVEAESSGTQANIRRLEVEMQEDRRRRAEEVSKLETKDAEQHVVQTELRSRLDLLVESVRAQLASVAGDARVRPIEGVVQEHTAQLSSLRAQVQAGTEALQVQHEALRSQLQDHIVRSEETVQNLALKFRTAELGQSTTSQVMSARRPSVNREPESEIEVMVFNKVSAAMREEWTQSLERKQADILDKVKVLGRNVREEACTQAASQARIVVQSILSQELDAWRQELNAVRDKIARGPDTARGRSRAPEGGDDDDARPEPPGLTEAVKRLDERLAMQRREAGALDELLRSELEVQRRQQSLTTASLQTFQERLVAIERANAIQSQTEVRSDFDSVSMGSGGGVPTYVSDNPPPLTARPVPEANAQGTAPPPSGDEIHRRIKALSAKMAACQDGSLTLPLAQSMNAPLGPVGNQSPKSSRKDAMHNVLNMPQAMQELNRANSNFSYRQPSAEANTRDSFGMSIASPSSRSRGAYAYRQTSPTATGKAPAPFPSARQTSPGASARNTSLPRRQESAQAMNNNRSLVPEHRIQRIASASINAADRHGDWPGGLNNTMPSNGGPKGQGRQSAVANAGPN